MNGLILKINGLEVDFETLVLQNKEWGKEPGDYLPKKVEKVTLIPVQLIVSLFGFTFRREEYLNGFNLIRDNKEVVFTFGEKKIHFNGEKYLLTNPLPDDSDKPLSVPLGIFTKFFGFSARWESDKVLNIEDPVTLPFYQAFIQRYAVSRIYRTLLVDLNEDGTEELVITYHAGENSLGWAALTGDGNWLWDHLFSIELVQDVQILDLSGQKALAVNGIKGEDKAILSICSYRNSQLEAIQEFATNGKIQLAGNEIHLFLRREDEAKHGQMEVYRWDESRNQFVIDQRDYFLWYGKSQVDRKNAESVARGFCEAIALRLTEEALDYCTEDVVGDINGLVEYHFWNKPAGRNPQLFLNVLHHDEGKFVMGAFYAELNIKNYSSPKRIVRMVLEMTGEEWKITYVRDLQDTLPLDIHWSRDFNVQLNDSIFTNWPRYTLDLGGEYWVIVQFLYQEKIIARQDVFCKDIEFMEFFPGILFIFSHDSNHDQYLKCINNYIESANAEKVSITRDSWGRYEILISLAG